MSIFVIDDHPLMREAVVMLLRRLRTSTQVIELERLATVSRAIAEHGEPELVCLDLKLPDTNGVSGVREVRQMLRLGSPVDGWEPLVVTSTAARGEVEDLMSALDERRAWLDQGDRGRQRRRAARRCADQIHGCGPIKGLQHVVHPCQSEKPRLRHHGHAGLGGVGLVCLPAPQS